MPEIWHDCVGFENYYEVSNQGNIRRKGKNKNKVHVLDKDGYYVHIFSCSGKRTNVMVHQLVAEAFNGPRPIGLVTRHRDGVPTNNFPSNLVYGTPAQNSQDMINHNTQCKGIDNHLAVLTEADVISIRAAYPAMSQSQLARHYGVTQSNIWNIVNRITWKHI